jgi:hypothetical protein
MFVDIVLLVLALVIIGLLIMLIYSSYCTNLKLALIMATQAELAQELRDVKEQNDKSRAEILDKIADLEQAVIDAGNVTPEVQTALDELKASVQTDDDIVPDEQEEPEVPEP